MNVNGMVVEFCLQDKNSWGPAIDYGLSLEILREQLDFIVK